MHSLYLKTNIFSEFWEQHHTHFFKSEKLGENDALFFTDHEQKD